jgi:hypothetical protein
MGLAEKLDNFIMGGINELVYSWNYLTGRTKTDLAQLLNATAPVFEVSAVLADKGILEKIFAPIFFLITYASHHDYDLLSTLKGGVSTMMLLLIQDITSDSFFLHKSY